MANAQKKDKQVTITQYKWAGRRGPFKIKSQCDECNLVTHTLKVMMDQEFKEKNVKLEILPWLDNAFYCLARGAWHPPIIMINGKKFFQFSKRKPMFDRAKLVSEVEKVLS